MSSKSKLFFRRIISVLLCIATLLSLTVYAAAASSDITVTNKYQIYASDTRLNEAAKYLNKYIKEICGYSLKIVSKKPTNSNYISLAIKSAAKNGYTITSDSKNIFITGSTLRNTVDGICGFLRKYGGINFYTSNTVVKSKKSITVPVNTKYSYSPYFEMTETDWYSPADVDYSLFNGITGVSYRDIPKELGGGAEYISSFCHTYTNQFCSKDKYFESNPECFALSAVARNKESLCLSNPKTLEIVTSEVLDLLKEKHDKSADLQIISLTQNDNLFFCTCPKCIAKYIKYGSISGLNLEFANAVAHTVKEKGYNNVAIDTFAYMYTRSAPKHIVPEDNVIIRLCSLECCFSHPLNDKRCAVNMGFAKDLEDWGKICSRVYVWDYVSNFCNFIGIFPNFNVLQENMQFFYENNVKGIYEEGNYGMTECDTEFGELRAYLLCKLMQEPYCDLEAERAAFLKAYYGNGGKYIGEFLDIVSESAYSNHMSIYSSMKSTCDLSRKQIAECDALWESAKAESKGTALQHIKNSELAWRYWKYENNASEYKKLSTRKETKAQYDEEIAAAPIKWYRECSDTKAFFLYILQDVRFVLSDVFYPLLWVFSKI